MKENRRLLERGVNEWSEDSIRLIMTPSNVARSIYFYAQEIGYFKTSFPYFSERENLESFLIVYTLSGKGYLEYEGQTHTLGEGQCFFINCEKHHLYRTEEGSNWEFLWIHFNGNSALGYYEESVKNGFRILNCQNQAFMKETMQSIIELHQKRTATTELQVSNLINSILTELLIQVATNDSDIWNVPDYVKMIAREIDRNFRMELSLEYFEKLTYRSRYHILKEFKKYMGVTINEYIITTRITYAKELLKYTDMPVGEIAFETGMHNVTHFINLFKVRAGTTPLSYRKMWRD